jgi:hypothetical protein
MTWGIPVLEILTGFFGSLSFVSVVTTILVYRQYLQLAASSMEYAAMVIESLEEQEDGSIRVDPLALAGTSMDHISQLSGLLKWIRF